MTNEELKEGMLVLVYYNGGHVQAKVIGKQKSITANHTEIIGWKLHVGPQATEMTFTADKILPKT